MNKLLALLAIGTVAGLSPTLAQNSGLYGKKAFVELHTVGNFSALNNFLSDNPYYKRTGSNSLVESKDNFNGGMLLTAGIAVKNNVALSIEAGSWFFSIAGPPYVHYTTYDGYQMGLSIRHENIDVRTFSVMPIVEIGQQKSLLPVGISHQFGIGYASSKAVEKDYVIDPVDNTVFYYDGNNNVTVDANTFLDSLEQRNGGFVDYSQRYKGMTFLYGLKVRTPINEQLMITYGLRYTMNFGQKSTNYYSSDSDPDLWIEQQIRKTRLRSVLSLNLGIAYAF